MAKATWNGLMLAESDNVETVEGNTYFPPESVKTEYLKDSGKDYTCPWKGHADYYDVVAGDSTMGGAAWIYPDPKPAAANIKGYVAFNRVKGVNVEK